MRLELHLLVQGLLLDPMFDHTCNPICCYTVWVVYPSRQYVLSSVVYSYLNGAGIMGHVTATRGQPMVYMARLH
jgi:hypothetical protein